MREHVDGAAVGRCVHPVSQGEKEMVRNKFGGRISEYGVRYEATEGKSQVRWKREFKEGGTVCNGFCWRSQAVQGSKAR